MSSALIQALVGDLDLSVIPPAITFLQTVLPTPGGPPIDPVKDALALAQLRLDLFKAAPNLLGLVATQLDAALITKLQAVLASKAKAPAPAPSPPPVSAAAALAAPPPLA